MRVLLISGLRWCSLTWLGLSLVAAGACYSPTIEPGLACSETANCPNAQECLAGICVSDSADPDGSGMENAVDAGFAPDAMPDATICPSGSQNFGFTGTVESFVVPDCVTLIHVEAMGAQGGGGRSNSALGGKGARIQGDITITGGKVLQILVGERGRDAQPGAGNFIYQHAGGSGGGGSFVVDSMNRPLLIAGGGGGASDHSGGPTAGGPGQAGENGQDGTVNAQGGTEGSGGVSSLNPNGFHTGTGGGGLIGNGVGASDGNLMYGAPNFPGSSFVNGGFGGTSGQFERDGGFGGGGSAGFTGGGGGGYSGGGSGGFLAQNSGGGGGGSFNVGENIDNTAGIREGNGEITISW